LAGEGARIAERMLHRPDGRVPTSVR
jgi:hypothetical protein